jgi:hypothetical protein
MMTHMILAKTSSITLAFALTAASASAASAVATTPSRLIHVRDFGAVADGMTDAGNGIRAAIAAAVASGQPAEVVLDAGTYRVRATAPRETCFPIHQATNLVVRGAGKLTRIVIADPASGGFGLRHRAAPRAPFHERTDSPPGWPCLAPEATPHHPQFR